MHRWTRLSLAACAACITLGAAASELTRQECAEGSDFIANAAHARENGITRKEFIGRMEQDLLIIQAFPPDLRWFAKDRDDAALLLEFARQVFDHPEAPQQHRKAFLASCLHRDM